jgi:hypothetical protein
MNTLFSKGFALSKIADAFTEITFRFLSGSVALSAAEIDQIRCRGPAEQKRRYLSELIFGDHIRMSC